MDTYYKNKLLKPGVQWKIIALLFAILFTASLFFQDSQDSSIDENLIETVLPEEGVELPIKWGDLGKKLVETGVIDKKKFMALYEKREGLDKEAQRLLERKILNSKIVLTSKNANILLNLLWAFGLSNKNPILEQGPMVDKKYGGDPSRFASIGGWTLAQGNAIDHYSKHSFITLNTQQQLLVERVAKNIFRPCCANPTYFPDCNHGMAMLGLLELMAYNGVDEEKMYSIALKVNSYWFPQAYITIAKYFKNKGIKWSDVNPKLVLGKSFSSILGYQRILSEVKPVESRIGGSCGV